ncbi:MAG: hypothetical protein U1F26_08915 [Lysobacterales bacterium]
MHLDHVPPASSILQRHADRHAQEPFPLSRARPVIGLDARFRGNDELTDLRCQFASTAKASSADGPRKPELAATPGAARRCADLAPRQRHIVIPAKAGIQASGA